MSASSECERPFHHEAGRASGRVSRLVGVLVSAEVALTVVLLTGAGLLVRTVVNLQRLDPGFERARLVTFALAFVVVAVAAGASAARS